MTERIIEDFIGLYGKESGIRFFFAPGRVNLIGEHTDYNGGYVMPCALTYGTYLAVRRNRSGMFRFSSKNFPGVYELSWQQLRERQGNAWVNYPLGVFDQFILEGHELDGLELLYWGDIPPGAGLSSSASIEVVTATALDELFALGIPKVDLARLCQRAENDFVGMKCGIMDQFASALSEKDHALFLNCGTLNFVHVPLSLGDISLVISNTNKSRELAGSKYNERRAQCEQAVEDIRKERMIKNLGQLHVMDFEKLFHNISDDTVMKRARHVVTENMRTLEAAKALHHHDIACFGRLMNQSHASLRDDYEVSCAELDILTEEATKLEGVYGSRMTGGGFGGCTISLVDTGKCDRFTEIVGKEYARRSGLKADFYIAGTGGGACRLA